MSLISAFLRSLSLLESYYLDRLRKVYINVTARCNSRCLYCETHALDHREDLTLRAVLTLLDECESLGVRNVQLAGGEPFCRKDIWEILRNIADNSLSCIIDTNGLMVQDFTSQELELISRSVAELEISLDSPREETHDFLRGRTGAFRRTVKGLEKLTILSNLRVVIFSVITRYNFRHIPDLVSFVRELGYKDLWFLPLLIDSNYPMIKTRQRKTELLVEKHEFRELEEVIDRSMEIARALSVRTNLSFIRSWMPFFFESQLCEMNMFDNESLIRHFCCVVPFESVYVSYRGGVQPCAMLPECGNLAGSSLAKELERIDPLKRALKKGDFPEECRYCMCQFETNLKFSILNSPLANRRHLTGYLARMLADARPRRHADE